MCGNNKTQHPVPIAAVPLHGVRAHAGNCLHTFQALRAQQHGMGCMEAHAGPGERSCRSFQDCWNCVRSVVYVGARNNTPPAFTRVDHQRRAHAGTACHKQVVAGHPCSFQSETPEEKGKYPKGLAFPGAQCNRARTTPHAPHRKLNADRENQHRSGAPNIVHCSSSRISIAFTGNILTESVS
jgi:hypothetical protein